MEHHDLHFFQINISRYTANIAIRNTNREGFAAKQEEVEDVAEQIQAKELPYKEVLLIKINLQMEEDPTQTQEVCLSMWKIWAYGSKLLSSF